MVLLGACAGNAVLDDAPPMAMMGDEGLKSLQTKTGQAFDYDANPDAAERGKVIQDSALSIEYAKAAIHRSNLDQAFLERMIPHRRAIEMSQLALRKATRQELKGFAQNVISAQGRGVNSSVRGLGLVWGGHTLMAVSQSMNQPRSGRG